MAVSAELTPVDELTGIPLPIVPEDEVLELLRHSRLNANRRAEGREFADWNHAYHPKPDPLLTSQDGRAVRDCRTQLVMRRTHDEYHHAYSGPVLPRNEEERFRAVVFAVAGYIPAMAIDLSGDSPEIIELSNRQKRRLQISGEVRPMHTHNIAAFLDKCVLSRPTGYELPGNIVDEFLSLAPTDVTVTHDTAKAERQLQLTSQLLKLVIGQATDPLVEAYEESTRDRRWWPGRGNPRHIVQHVLVGHSNPNARRQKVRRIGGILFDALAAQRDGDVVAA